MRRSALRPPGRMRPSDGRTVGDEPANEPDPTAEPAPAAEPTPEPAAAPLGIAPQTTKRALAQLEGCDWSEPAGGHLASAWYCRDGVYYSGDGALSARSGETAILLNREQYTGRATIEAPGGDSTTTHHIMETASFRGDCWFGPGMRELAAPYRSGILTLEELTHPADLAWAFTTRKNIGRLCHPARPRSQAAGSIWYAVHAHAEELRRHIPRADGPHAPVGAGYRRLRVQYRLRCDRGRRDVSIRGAARCSAGRRQQRWRRDGRRYRRCEDGHDHPHQKRGDRRAALHL